MRTMQRVTCYCPPDGKERFPKKRNLWFQHLNPTVSAYCVFAWFLSKSFFSCLGVTVFCKIPFGRENCFHTVNTITVAETLNPIWSPNNTAAAVLLLEQTCNHSNLRVISPPFFALSHYFETTWKTTTNSKSR